MNRRALLAALVGVGLLAATVRPVGAVGVGVISKKNMEWVFNVPQAVGADIEFYENRLEDGSLKRYAVATSMGNGFTIIDITNPALPVLAGASADPGVSWQGDVQVNPKRKIVSVAYDGAPAASVNNAGLGDGIALYDISDVARPTLLSVVKGLGGAHNATMVGDNFIYTSSPTRIVEYTNATAPVNHGTRGFNFCSTHDITVDPNIPNRIHLACPGNTYQIVDVTDPLNPVEVARRTLPQVATAHQADPAPDSSFVAISDEQGGGLTCVQAPCGGLHVYDISGRYVANASEGSPQLAGRYYIPFYRPMDPSANQPWGNNTAHNFTFQSERALLSIGWYTVGSWVVDMQHPTNNTGPYAEYAGTQFGGPTTWGNTQGNILLEGAETWSAKWARFDDPAYDRYVFTNDITRGVDVLRYTGGMPKKIARLNVDAEATGGSVTGKLDRFAVWTYQGWVNKPLAGKTVTVSVPGGASATVTTEADGSFSADLGLEAGSHDVVVTWNDSTGVYQTATATQTVSA
ncbi:MAG TPA: hypothetical protein VGB28_05725 [Actinomycetota bacterium]|jgi:hypothetical protein